MFARHIEHPVSFCGLQQLIRRIELFRSGEMGNVAGMEQKRRRDRQGVDFGDGCLQSARHIRVGRLAEPDVAVADLREMRRSSGRRFICGSLGETLRD